MRITTLALAALAGVALLFTGPQSASAAESSVKHELGHVAIGVGLGVIQQAGHNDHGYGPGCHHYGGHGYRHRDPHR